VTENRLVDIESKLAHQEHLLTELNTALSSQQQQLTRLETLCETLLDRVRTLSDAAPAGDPADERPPHS
jgi:SlyX protein